MHPHKKWMGWLTVLFIFAWLITACGAGNSGVGTPTDEDDTPAPEDGNGNTSASAVFPGYDFILAEGSFWEFGFDEYRRSWYLSTSNTSTAKGIFRLTLGTPVTIQDVTAYPITIMPVSGDDISETLSLRWDYIALDAERILGSTDGSTLEVIFDAYRGSQAGGGFFTAFTSDALVTASMGQIDNDYLSDTAAVLSMAASSGGCEYFPDIGTICPGDDREGVTVRDYFQAEVGPAGYYYYAYSTDSQGDSGAVIEINIGLLAFSAEGDGLYDPPDVPVLTRGTLAIYYSLYDGLPAMVYDLYNAPTPTDLPGVLMRYLPRTQASAALTPAVAQTTDWGYHALTEGNRLLVLKRKSVNDDIQVIEYDPADHTPIGGTTTVIKNSSAAPIHYAALTAAGEDLYYQTYSATADLDPWSDTIYLYGQSLGALSRTTLATSAGYNHILNDGAGLDSPFAAFFIPQAGDLCPSGNYLYYYQRLDLDGGISPVDLGGACEAASFFADLDSIGHSFAIDANGLYLARSYGDVLDIYRIDRNSGAIDTVYHSEITGSHRRLLIDVSDGYVLLHILDGENGANNSVVLLNTQNTSATTDDTLETLVLPGSGIPMNLQLLVTP